jgi:hypothetical protein
VGHDGSPDHQTRSSPIFQLSSSRTVDGFSGISAQTCSHAEALARLVVQLPRPWPAGAYVASMRRRATDPTEPCFPRKGSLAP